MHFNAGHIYHLYNRGNHKEPLFLSDDNYFFFLRKVRIEWRPFCEILAYCLMPNHFHFMLSVNEIACQPVYLANKQTHIQELSKAIGKTLSSYTNAFNIQNKTSGNLFQKKTTAKCIDEPLEIIRGFSVRDYLLCCFNYIHYTPLVAGLVTDLMHWPYSSWPDYYGFRNGTLCNKQLAKLKLSFSQADFDIHNSSLINPKIVEQIW
jgi:REP-associated tyrosine transposase